MSAFDRLYQNLLGEILLHGAVRHDRTGVGTTALFGRTLELDMQGGFPLLTLRSLNFGVVLTELLWMLKGIDDPQWLLDREVAIWQPWVAPVGGLGPTIGQQWRAWTGPDGRVHDQLSALLEGLRERPHSRRHILSAWNVGHLPDETLGPHDNATAGRMALAPCLVTQQFFVEGGRLSLLVNQRSADVYLGFPHDVAGAALLLHLVARTLGLQPHRLVTCLGDVHLYSTHVEQARELLRRAPASAPRLVFATPPRAPQDYEPGDIAIADYSPGSRLTGVIAV